MTELKKLEERIENLKFECEEARNKILELVKERKFELFLGDGSVNYKIHKKEFGFIKDGLLHIVLIFEDSEKLYCAIPLEIVDIFK